MNVKSVKSVGVIVASVLMLIVLSATSLVPGVLRTPDKYNLKHHVQAFLESTFDLANTAENDLQGYGWGKRAVNLVNASLTGQYPVELDEIRIDIKFKHWLTVNTDRDRSLQKLVLRNASWVPSKIRFQNRTLKANVRLKGHLGEHRYLPNRWSLRIKLKGNEAIKGFTQFSLLRPAARQFPSDQLYQFWHQSIGGLSPKFKFVRVFVNGDDWGIMLMEEHVTKTMVELNHRKEAPVFKLVSKAEEGGYFQSANEALATLPEVFYSPSEPSLYSARKYRDDDRILRLFSYALAQFRQLNRQGIKAQDILDTEAFTKSLILVSAWGSGHTLNHTNSRFYLNPYTLLVEPINTDQTRYLSVSKDTLQRVYSGGLWQQGVYSQDFDAMFNRILEDIKSSLPGLTARHQELCKNFPLDCPAFHPEILKENLIWVEQVAKPEWIAQGNKLRKHPPLIQQVDLSIPGPSNSNDAGADEDVDYPEHIIAEHSDDGMLRIYNMLSRPVTVTGIRLVCTRKSNNDCQGKSLLNAPFSLMASTKQDHLFFETWDTAVGDLGKTYNIEIDTMRNGQTIRSKVNYTLRTDVGNPLLLNRDAFSDTRKPDWLTLDGKTAYVVPGTWAVEAPLVLPIGTNLHVPPGTTLQFADDAYMIVRGAIVARGQKDAQIEFSPQNKKWKGLYVLNAQDTSDLSHVNIRGTGFLVDGVLNLTGGVTFYKSDVSISHSTFTNSDAEDALNIVHSGYKVSDTVFRGTRSDALDTDFSNGEILRTAFYNVGGDGVDLSGSKLSASGLSFDHVWDKAISVGEKSHLKARDIAVNDAGSAVVSKDGSETYVDDLSVKASRGYPAMAYVKKPIYGTAVLNIINSNLQSKDVQNQSGNTLILEGQSIADGDIDVDALYNSEQMKK